MAIRKGCKNCGKPVATAVAVYCSSKCSQAFRNNLMVEEWLRTGKGRYDSHDGHYIREHIRQEQQSKCAICGIDPVWNDIELVLVLDHIDGSSENNARSNLRLLCPNCDSQLPTYKSKNKGNGRYSRRQRYAEGKSY